MLRLESQRGLAAAVGEDAHLFLSQRGLRVLACAILRKGMEESAGRWPDQVWWDTQSISRAPAPWRLTLKHL